MHAVGLLFAIFSLERHIYIHDAIAIGGFAIVVAVTYNDLILLFFSLDAASTTHRLKLNQWPSLGAFDIKHYMFHTKRTIRPPGSISILFNCSWRWMRFQSSPHVTPLTNLYSTTWPNAGSTLHLSHPECECKNSLRMWFDVMQNRCRDTLCSLLLLMSWVEVFASICGVWVKIKDFAFVRCNHFVHKLLLFFWNQTCGAQSWE